MNKNKEKEIVSGEDVVRSKGAVPIETRPSAPQAIKFVALSSSGKRNTMTKNINRANLPSHRPYKKQKIDSSTPVGTPLVELNPSVPGVIYETLTIDVSVT